MELSAKPGLEAALMNLGPPPAEAALSGEAKSEDPQHSTADTWGWILLCRGRLPRALDV